MTSYVCFSKDITRCFCVLTSVSHYLCVYINVTPVYPDLALFMCYGRSPFPLMWLSCVCTRVSWCCDPLFVCIHRSEPPVIFLTLMCCHLPLTVTCLIISLLVSIGITRCYVWIVTCECPWMLHVIYVPTVLTHYFCVFFLLWFVFRPVIYVSPWMR